MTRKLVTTTLALFAVLVLSTATSYTQMTTMPIYLKAEVSASGEVELHWANMMRDTFGMYSIFRATLHDSLIYVMSPDLLKFDKIDSTTRTEYTDHPSIVRGVSYVYYVSTKNSKGVVVRSNYVTARFPTIWPRTDIVTITSKAAEYAQIGVEYKYQVVAKSSDSTAKLTYTLLQKPAGMTIDSTGLMTWTPQVKGSYYVYVVVASSKGGVAKQYFSIRVAAGSGIVEGIVTDTAGAPIAKVLVRLFSNDRMYYFEYKGVTEEDGKYKIEHVEVGTYYVRAEPLTSEYLPEWYENAQTLMQATKISVMDGGTTTVHFQLQPRFTPTAYFTVTGKVIDTARLAPIRGAVVVFAEANFSLNSSRANNVESGMSCDHKTMFDTDRSFDHRLSGNSRFVYKARVDSLGQYSVRLPQGSYVAFAEAKGYVKIFYNNKTNLLTADVIVVNSNISDINFALPPLPPVVLGGINGAVIDSTTGLGVRARVIAWRDRWVKTDSWRMARQYVTDTDSTGKYSLTDLLPGDYIVFAIPMGSYTPSFYSTSGTTHRWHEATKITISGNVVAGIDIYVKPMARTTSGYTYVSGTVTATATVAGKMGMMSSVGVSGTMVYAADANGSLLGYGVTDAIGSYVIAGLTPGTYKLFADNPGYTSSNGTTASPTYTPMGSPQPASSSFTLNPVGTTDVSDETPIVPTDYVVEQNYPNPFNPSTQIVFSIPQAERVTVAIFNILGQKIATLVDRDLTAGYHSFVWDGKDDAGRNVSTGVYLYRISTPSFVATKKMTLLK